MFIGHFGVGFGAKRPPPSPAAVAWVTQSMWLLVAWGYWVDRHRQPSGITSRPAASRR